MTIGRHQPPGRIEQRSRPGARVDAPAPHHRLFFAVFPDDGARRAIALLAEDMRLKRMLRGRWVDPLRYHMTVHFLGNHAELRQDLVDRAEVAATQVQLPAFVLSLERLAGFPGRKPPGVLRCADGTTPVHALWQALRRELVDVGLGAALEAEFTPHITLFYGDGAMLDPVAIEPIAWTVREFVLVHSVAGRKDYRIVARWALPG